jgi:hypothetical protein
MPGLPPAGQPLLASQSVRQRGELADAIQKQARIGRVVDVRLDHEAVATDLPAGLRRQLVTCLGDHVGDLFQRLRTKLRDVLVDGLLGKAFVR